MQTKNQIPLIRISQYGMMFLMLLLALYFGNLVTVRAQGGVESEYSTTRTIILKDGTSLDEVIIHGPPTPPHGFELERAAVELPEPNPAMATNTLTVPAFNWVFGCSSVSGAMIAGYYDRNGFPNMYTGPTNGGIMPLDNSSWPTWSDGFTTYPNLPLAASHNGVDGRATKGSIDDYWVQYGSSAADPYITGSWTQHAWSDAIGDYMKTSQTAYSNTDGSTTFYNWTSSASPLTCAEMVTNNIHTKDGTYGRKLFYEARGYTVTDCYSQKTDNTISGGFSFTQYKAEIDAGRPVMLNLEGHTIVGVGYDDTNTVYIHDTWDYLNHSMTWGGSYAGMQLLSVSIVNLQGLPSAPGAFNKSSPSNNATDQSTSPTLSWGVSSGATSYEYCYYTTEITDCDEPWTLTTTNTSVGLSGLSADTTYHWQVRAVNAGGTTYADGGTWWAFTTTVPGVIFVKHDATGADDGSSWENAFTDLQDALAVAISGDEIWVAAGSYKPTSGADRAVSFVLKNGVAIYGGFDSVDTERDQRDPVANETILSGDLNGDDVGFTNNAENSYHVVVGGGTDSSAVLDGFTIRGGNANGDWPHRGGGGMVNYGSSPSLTALTFSGNTASNYGGGMYNNGSNPVLTNVIFSGNTAPDGGGMSNGYSSPALTNVTFSGNSADRGGGMNNGDSSLTLTNVTFSGNTASHYGGGMYNSGGGSTLVDVTFSGNTAFHGGGMYNSWSSPTLTNVNFNTNSASSGGGMYNIGSGGNPILTNVTFSNNTASSHGGGMYNYDYDSNNPMLSNVTFNSNSAMAGGAMYNWSASPALTNTTFSDNTASSDGGGMYNYMSKSTLTDVTFSRNTADWGGGIYNSGGEPTLVNVIFSDNSATYGGGISNFDSSNPSLADVTFSDNTASDDGGGMYNENSSPTLTDTTFSGNSAYSGGGMFNNSSSPVLTNVNFSDNVSSFTGAGMYNENSSPTLTDTTFSGNSANSGGGGMCNNGSSPTLMNVTFSGNTAGSGGGMSNSWHSSPILTNVTFSGNTSSNFGGGMANYSYSNPSLTNVTFSGNTASYWWGGGMYNEYSDPTLTNVTLSGNTAAESGGGISNRLDSDPTIINTILWGNSAPSGAQIFNYDSESVPVITYSIVQGGWPGLGNLDADPLLVNPAIGNLHLQAGSPAMEAGNDAAVPTGITTDRDGNPRFVYTVDMGAYEYQGTEPRSFSKSAPADSAANQPLNQTLSWGASTGATSYAYCYYTTTPSDCNDPWALTTTNTSVGLSGLLAGTTYHWQVRAVNPGGTIDANGGTWWSFTTIPLTLTKTLQSTGAYDGWILESAEHSNAGGTLDSTATTFRLGDDAADTQYRAILHFNTATLPDDAVITKVTLKIKKQVLVGTNPFTIFSGLKVDMRKPYFGANAGLVIGDFQAAAGKSSVATFGATPVGNWYSALLNATGRAYINKTGTTQFRLRFETDDNDDNDADYMKFFSGNYATVIARPTLVIEYYVP